MTRWSCKEMCRKYHVCVELDRCIVARQVNRIDNPRRKIRIEIIYEWELGGTSHERYINCVWGTGKDE